MTCRSCVDLHMQNQRLRDRLARVRVELARLQPQPRRLAPPTADGHRLFTDWLRAEEAA